MRAQALLGGAALFAAVAAWHRPAAVFGASGSDGQTCPPTNSAGFCDAVNGLSRVVHNPILTADRETRLPPPETPEAVDPAITQGNIDATICRPGYARSARPSYSATAPLKRRMMDSQHPGAAMADYELDHLIPISIGGAPLDLRDLWLQPRQGQANAGDKNVLAYVLWRLVCTHQLPLETAQCALRHDWTRAYETYATPENIAKYHIRHAEQESD